MSMKKTFVLWLLIAGSLVAQSVTPSPTSGDVAELLLQYHVLCTDVVTRIQMSSTETQVTDVFPMYLAGWLHSSEAIPELLARLELPGANEPGSRKIAKRPPGGIINPIVIASAGLSPTPPTPAAGAMTLLPISFDCLTNLLCEAGTETARAEYLAWIATVKFREDFQAVVENGCVMGRNPWPWIRHLQMDEWEPNPAVPIHFYRRFFPEEDVSAYTNIFYSLRGIATEAETSGNSELKDLAMAALLEIGHSFHENPDLWP